jgi:hypothetical protein
MHRWISRVSLAAALTLVVDSSAAAQTRFYNGQYNGVDAQSSSYNTYVGNIMLFDNFVVGGSGWQVSGLFGEYFTDNSWTTASWEIRSGITPGNGGTLVASGTGATTNVATGRSGGRYVEYRTRVTGLNLLLAPGTYWLGISPIAINSATGDIYLSRTSGLNGVNALIDGDYFGRTPTVAYAEYNGLPNLDFAYGVEGTLVTGQQPPSTTVPEPSTFVLVITALSAMVLWRRRAAARLPLL